MGLRGVSGPEVAKGLRRLGWYEYHCVGSHMQMRHAEHPGKITVPMHKGQALSPKVVKSILGMAGVSAEQLKRAM